MEEGRAGMDYHQADYEERLEFMPADTRGPQRVGQVGGVLARLKAAGVGFR